MLDCVIKGGTVVDGTGAPARRADVGHPRRPDRRGRRRSTEDAAETIDAGGLVVAPGHRRSAHALRRAAVLGPGREPVEPARRHQHDRAATAASRSRRSHPVDADYLRRMMAKVEGMPLPALETGVPWNWRTLRRLPRRARRQRRRSTSGSSSATARCAAT